MKYRNYLFDWDGSLGDSLPMWFEAFKVVFLEYGIAADNQIIAQKVLGDWNGPANLGVDDVSGFFVRLEEVVDDKLSQVRLNDGALITLGKIKEAGGKVAVVTTSKRQYVEQALKNSGAMDFIDVFLGMEDVEHQKPHPEQLLKALSLMGGIVKESLMVGDTGKDIMAAKSCEMDNALYYPERYSEFYLKEEQVNLSPTYLIRDFDEIMSFG